MTDALDDTTPADGDQPAKQRQYGDVVPVPQLLDPKTEDPTVCRTLHRIWSDQRDKYARYVPESEVNLRRRGGECNIWVQKVQDQSVYTIYVPAGRSLNLLDQFGNLTDQTCQQFVSQITQDPAKPEAVPSTGEDEDRDAAEFTTRILVNECSESGLDANEAMKAAQDLACSYGSAWIWVFTDLMGGGRQPVEIQAHPMAPHADQATINPETMAEAGPDELESRYVREDGSLTGNRGESSLRWVPKVCRQVVPGTHVRLWPSTAQDVWDADALVYLDYQPVSVAKEWFPDLKMTDDEWREATEFRLVEANHLLPKRNGRPHDPKPQDRPEEWLVLIACLWAPEGSAYPDGAYLGCLGNKKVAHRGTWILEQEDGSREKRDIPWTQIRQFRGTKEHPQGKGLVSFIGSACEFLAELWGRFAELTEMAAGRKVLLPYTATIKPSDLNDPGNGVLYFQPGQKPEYEQVPEPPRALEKLIQMVQQAIKEASFIETGAGLDAPDANSGRQALAIAAQAHAGVSDVNQNHNRAWVRLWRIMLQCIRADYSIPQLLRVTGPDGSYKVERWTKSDLGSTRDVQIAKGSGTLMNQVQKVQMYAESQQLMGLSMEDIQEQMSTGLSSVVAFEDNRGLQRIRRQIAEWEKGPPEGWQPPQAPIDPLTGGPMTEPAVDPMTGQPAIGPDGLPIPGQPVPPPPDPLLAQIWTPVESDMAPIVAKWRIRELTKSQQSKRYLDLPPEWRLGLDFEYRRAQSALAPPAPPQAPPAIGKPPATKDAQGAPQLSPMEQAAAQ